jgi:hypothetical protein
MTTASVLTRLTRLEALVAALADPPPLPEVTQLMRGAGLDPDPWQIQVLQSQAPRGLWLCSRQSGKSATAACLALHTALAQPGALVLLLSPSLR